MQTPDHLESMDGYCRFRLSGHGALADAASQVIDALTLANKRGVRRLLIDTTHWTGHESPGTLERFEVAAAFAKAAGSKMRLAMVVRPEMMDPDKFEVLVAKNRGLTGNVFDSEKEALAWLLNPDAR